MRFHEIIPRGQCRCVFIAVLLIRLSLIPILDQSLARSACFADDRHLTEPQQTRLRLSDLEWALGVDARDEHQDPIRATHHFLRAAQEADLAGQTSRAKSCLIAAEYSAQARDRYLIHPVSGAVFSPDSTRFITYNDGPMAWLWDVERPEPAQSFRHQKEVLAAKFNSDGTRVLSYSRDGSVQLWKVGQAEPLETFQHDAEVTGVKFTADESKILSWSQDKAARIWDVNQPNQPLLTFRHDGPVTDAVFNADESKLLTSGDDNTARLWNAKTGKLIHKLIYKPRDHLDAWMKTKITEPAFRDDESHISFRCYDGIYLWDAKSGGLIDRITGRRFTTGKPRFLSEAKGVVSFYEDSEGQATRIFQHGLEISSDVKVKVVGFNQNRTRFLTTLNLPYYGHTHEGWVQLWEIEGEKLLRTFRHEGLINGASFLNHSDQILTYSQDGTAKLWDITQSQTPRKIRHQRSVTGALLSPDEKLLLTWTDHGTARLTELGRKDTGRLLGPFQPDYPGYFAWTRLPPDGLHAVTWGPYEKTIRHADILEGKTLRTFTLEGNVEDVTISPDRSHMFARSKGGGSSYSPARLWNLNHKEPVATFENVGQPVVFNPDASQVFFATKEGGVLYDVKQRKTIKRFSYTREGESIAKVAFTQDGLRILIRGYRQLRLWKIDGKSPLRTFERNQRIKNVVFSADGQRFLTWGEEHKAGVGVPVHLWDVSHDQPRQTFGSDDDFSRAVFSPDGSRVLSWSDSSSGSSRLWDAETGKLLTTFRRHGHIANGHFTPDGHRAMTTTWDNRAYLWDFHVEEPLREFQHTARFRVPIFTVDGRSLIAQGDDQVKRWSIAVDTKRTIEQQQCDYAIKSAIRLDPSGHLVPLSLEEWRQHREPEKSRSSN